MASNKYESNPPNYRGNTALLVDDTGNVEGVVVFSSADFALLDSEGGWFSPDFSEYPELQNNQVKIAVGKEDAIIETWCAHGGADPRSGELWTIKQLADSLADPSYADSY